MGFHDAAEDHGGMLRLKDIEHNFGKNVARMVEGPSDSLTDDPGNKQSWQTPRNRISSVSATLGRGPSMEQTRFSPLPKTHGIRRNTRGWVSNLGSGDNPGGHSSHKELFDQSDLLDEHGYAAYGFDVG